MNKMISAANKEVKNLIWKFEDYYRTNLILSSPYDWHVSLLASLYNIMSSDKEKKLSFGNVAEISFSWDAAKIKVLNILEKNIVDLSKVYNDLEIEILKSNFVQIVDFCLDFYNHDKLNSAVASFAQPKELTEACVRIANFEKDSEIYNPFSGLGGYAIMATNCHFTGEDISSYSWALSQISLFAHNVSASISESDSFNSLLKKDNVYDGAITTPSFRLKCNGKDEFDAIKYILENKIKESGKLVAVLPSAFLFTTALHSTLFKDYLLGSGYLRMVVTLPPRIFHPMTAISVCIIVAQKERGENVLLVDGTSFAKEGNGKIRYALDCEELLYAIESENPEFCVRMKISELSNTRLLAPTIYMQEDEHDGVQLRKLGDLVQLSSMPMGIQSTAYTEIRHIATQNLSVGTPDCEIDINTLENGEINPHRDLVKPYSIIMMASDRGLRLGYIKEIPEGMGISCPANAICFQIRDYSIGIQSLLIQLTSDYVSKQVSKLFVSFSRGYLSWGVLSFVKIPVPTIEEQLRQALSELVNNESKAELKQKNAFAEYETEIHSRKHAISQTLSAVSALWNSLDSCRNSKNGVLKDSDIVSRVTNMSVADVFEAISHRLNTLLVQADNLADVEYNWGEEEHIVPDIFIEEYINKHKDVRFKLLQENYHPEVYEENEVDPEDIFGIYFPPKALERVFDNIISNAVSHGFNDPERKDYRILFSDIFYDIDDFVIRISNNGTPLNDGVKPEDVFLYGFSTSLNESTKDGKEHHGLGGYDTRNILKKYNASVEIISTPNEEYTVTYVLTFTKTNIEDV